MRSKSIAVCVFFFLMPLFSLADTLIVAIYNAAPTAFMAEDGGHYGIMVEIWEEIATHTEYSFEYHPTGLEDLLMGLQDGRYDVGLGAITITPEREAIVDFSQPVNPSGTGFAMSKKYAASKFQLYYKPIIKSVGRLLIGLTLLLLTSAAIVWLAERKKHPEFQSRSRIASFYDGLWWSAVTMTTVGYGDKVPFTFLGRLVGLAWMFTSIVLVSLFTANAASILTKSTTNSTINSLADLRGLSIEAVMHSSGAEFLEREKFNYTPYVTLEEAVEAMLDENVEAVVSNVPFLQYLNTHKYVDQLIVSDNWLLKNNMGIALQPDSHYMEQVNSALLKLLSEEKWQSIVYRYLGEHYSSIR